MALLGGRNDSALGEQEMDANSALMELDKGLRSGKIGEQCEAVVRFPSLFEKYPFPILINSAFLKLADVFRVGNNFLRLCVLKVTQQSEKHLDKILNVDEFVKRAFSVIHSNDPVARAITIRLLGSIACIIPERKNAHHSIRESLDSHDGVEVEAAVFAAAKFAAQSRDFAAGICNKIGEMIQGLATPVELKIHLIPIFQHMHHDAAMATAARQLLTELAMAYPALRVLLVTLHTATQLAAAALLDIPQQIQLLLKYMHSDPRHAIKRLALQDLNLLAKKAPHVWGLQEVQALCSIVADTPYDGVHLGAMAVLGTLSGTVIAQHWFLQGGAKVALAPLQDLARLAQSCCQHDRLVLAACGASTLTNLLVAAQGADIGVSELEVVIALESLIIASSMEQSEGASRTLKTVLQSVVRLCAGLPRLGQRLLASLLAQMQAEPGEAACTQLCQALVQVSDRTPALVHGMLPELLEMYRKASRSTEQGPLLVVLASAIFMANQKVQSMEVKRIIVEPLDNTGGWTVYRIARQASRMGSHEVAAAIYANLRAHVASEHLYFWLNGLQELAQGEQALKKLSGEPPANCLSCLAEALVSCQRGMASLTAASTPQSPLNFQCEYAKLRIDTLQAFSQLFATCNSLRSNPPPAIAAALALNASSDLDSCTRIAGQMKQCIEEYQGLVRRYCELYQSAFDADPGSLRNIKLHQQSCLLIINIIETLILNQDTGSIGDCMEGGLRQVGSEAERSLLTAFQQSLQEVQNLQHKYPPASYQYISCLARAATTVLQVPLCLPRFFFQKLQSTSIKLALSPTPRLPNEPITIQSSQLLALKVEGVIQLAGRPGLFRQVQTVRLVVTASTQARPSTNNGKVAESTFPEQSQEVAPHNDYFSTHFLLAFPGGGASTVTVEASVVDADGAVWRTGPRSTLLVRSLDDSYTQGQGAQSQASGSSGRTQPPAQTRAVPGPSTSTSVGYSRF
uniref:integrator complex subunit 7 n=1 Tax=Myxine glutinosa TaxID=7769 RepID=UPI00358F2660